MTIADNTPLSLVHVLSNRIDRAFYGEIETRFGITLAEWRVMLTLTSEPGISATEITDRWAMEKMAVNRAVQHLIDQKLVVRARNANDGRRYKLNLTDKGQELYEKIAPSANRRYGELMSVIDKRESETLIAALRKIIERAEELN
ncbi:MAG: MarR family winged helix-turn-helix transcriptional regulator [Pseudomonadota bacterium]|nr:MarR family winged helix-turn-helix transcriptional regulator [Pseudomonadota bacterium]